MAQKKSLISSDAVKMREAVDPSNKQISISRQCELLGFSRSAYYYRPVDTNEKDLEYMKIIDEAFTKHPFYGSRRLKDEINAHGYRVGRDHTRSLMRRMGIEASYPKKRIVSKNKAHKIYPYLLRGMDITKPNHVWCTDITYIPLKHGYAYLVAVMDWGTRYVLSWELSMSLESSACISTLQAALSKSKPEIFNTDQGSQFTSNGFTKVLKENKIKISMDGRGRAFDNIMIERLWRTVKYEEVYLKEYTNFFEARESLDEYFKFYNEERRHSTLGNKTPSEAYRKGLNRLKLAS